MNRNQCHEFGNRFHGRFPRVAVVIEGGDCLMLSSSPDRAAFKHGTNYRCWCIGYVEAQKLYAALGEALASDEMKAARRRFKRAMRLAASSSPSTSEVKA